MSVMIARLPTSPPSARAPVSPMKILAGAQFHHRNPVVAPNPPAATIATSMVGSARSS